MKKILCGVILLLVAFASNTRAIPRPEPEPAQEKTVVGKRAMFFGVVEKVDAFGNAVVVRGMMQEKRTLTFAVSSKTKISKRATSLVLWDVKKGMQVTVEYQEKKDRLSALSIEVSGP